MKKINALLIILGIFIALGSCKKDKPSKVGCEIKLTRHVSSVFGSTSEDDIMRFNADGQLVEMVTPMGSYSYIYQKNEVIVRFRGSDFYKITLDNGRAVSILSMESKHIQKISYDSQGRMEQIVQEQEGIVGNIYTFSYAGGNLDYVLEKIKNEIGVERKYHFEYTNLKPDIRTQSFQSFYGQVLFSFIPGTFRGSGSLNLPSKMLYTQTNSSSNKVLNEYTYTTSPDGKVTSMSTEDRVPSELGEAVVVSRKVDISSTCE